MSTVTTSQYASISDDSDDDGHGQGGGLDHRDLTWCNYLQLDDSSDEDDSVSLDQRVRGEEEEALLGGSQGDGGEGKVDKGEDNWVGKKCDVMFSRGQILLEIHNAIAIMTQTWVGEKCEVFTS